MVHLHLFNRLLVALLALLLTAAGVFTVAATSGWIPIDPALSHSGWRWVVRELQALVGMTLFWTAAGGLGAIAFGFGLLVLELRVPARSRELVLAADRAGVVRVSLVGLRRLALHVIREFAEVEAAQAEVRPTRKGLIFTCRISVKPETNTPLLIDDLRRALNEALENHIGQAPLRSHFHLQVTSPPAMAGFSSRLGTGAPARRRVQ